MADIDEPSLEAAVVQAETRPPAPQRSILTWKTALKLTVSIMVIVLLARIIEWRELTRIVLSARLEILLLAVALLVIGNLMIAWRWKVLLAPVGIHASLRQSFESYLKGHFLAYFVPSGVTADLVKAVDMHGAQRGNAHPTGMELASSIFVERGFGAITVGFAVLLGLTLSPLVGKHADMQAGMMLAAAVIVACCVIALFADKFLALIPGALLARAPRLSALIERARNSFMAYRKTPARLVGVMLLSIVIQALRIIPIYVIGLALGAGNEFFPYLIAVPIIFLSAMVPVIGSRVGTEQGLFVLLLGIGGISAESALAIALLSLALGMLVALPGGYWLLKGRRTQ